MTREMMSGPDPGALPMMSRIGLSGNTACCAASAAHVLAASKAAHVTAANA
jgi:hypothetical protein